MYLAPKISIAPSTIVKMTECLNSHWPDVFGLFVVNDKTGLVRNFVTKKAWRT